MGDAPVKGVYISTHTHTHRNKGIRVICTEGKILEDIRKCFNYVFASTNWGFLQGELKFPFNVQVLYLNYIPESCT